MNLKHLEEWRIKSISELITLQADKLVEITETLEQVINSLLDREFKKMQDLAIIAINLEKECDRIKETIEEKLFIEKKNFQFTANDRHQIILQIEAVINQGEIVAQKVRLHDLKVPVPLIPGLKTLMKATMECVRNLRSTVNVIRIDFMEAMELAISVEDKRRETRNLCWDLLKVLYQVPTDPLTLVLTRELILEVTKIADLAENTSDGLTTLALKYSKI